MGRCGVPLFCAMYWTWAGASISISVRPFFPWKRRSKALSARAEPSEDDGVVIFLNLPGDAAGSVDSAGNLMVEYKYNAIF